MKRVLLVLLLFGAGLAVLLLLQRFGQRTAPRPTDAEREESPADQPSSPAVPTAGEFSPDEVTIVPFGSGDEKVGVVLRGEHQFTVFQDVAEPLPGGERVAARKKHYEYEGRLEPKGEGRYEIADARIRLYDQQGELRTVLEASLARLELAFSETGVPRISDRVPVSFQNVNLTLLSGAPIVPVTFHVPNLEWTVAADSFQSQDRVQLSAPGIEAGGTGLRIVSRLGAEEISLVREATNRIDLEGGLRADLETTGLGVLTYKNLGTPQDLRLALEVVDGARLLVREDYTLESRNLTLIGVRPPADPGGAAGKFRLESATATGEVVIRGQEGSFHGAEANVEFDAAGEPMQATLRGAPNGSLRLPPRSSPAGAPARLDFDGAGPLIVRFGERTTVEYAGPARIDLSEPRVQVSARGRITIDNEAAEGRNEFHAEDGVRVTYGEFVVECPRLHVLREEDEGGIALTRLQVNGPSTWNGRDERGRLIEATIRGLAVGIVRDDALTIEQAEGVDVRVIGAEGFRAEVASLRDFDPRGPSFRGEGGITFSSARGTARGAWVDVRGPEEFDLQGLPGEPARLEYAADSDSVRGRIAVAADAILATKSSFRARGAVVIEATIEGRESTLRAAEIDLLFDPAVDPGADALARGMHFHARGDVALDGRFAEREIELRAAELDLTIEAPASTAGGEREFQLRATEVSRAVLGEIVHGHEVRLVAKALNTRGRWSAADSSATSSGTGVRQLEAIGGVVLDVRTALIDNDPDRPIGPSEISGLGERFVYEEGGVARLEPGPQGRVVAHGKLAAGEFPFQLEADWLEFSGERLTAGDPELELARLPAPGDEGLSLSASAARLEADENALSFVGVARVEGSSLIGQSWEVEAETIRIERKDGADGVAGEELVAEGGYVATVNEELTSRGSRLTANAQRVRSEGRPALLEGPGFAWRSNWIELDVQRELVTTGPGEIRPVGGEAGKEWSVRYESLQPFTRTDVTILALRESIVTFEDASLRSDWALFWIDSEEWAKGGMRLVGRGDQEEAVRVTEVPTGSSATSAAGHLNLFDFLDTSQFARVLNELYIEGDVEFTRDKERVARAEAIYFDLVDGHGWIQDADFKLPIQDEDERQTAHFQAEWVRHSRDGSLRAESATMTTCSFEDPHYIMEIGNLSLTPVVKDGSGKAYRLSFGRNRLRVGNSISLALPSAQVETDEDGSMQNPRIGGFEVPYLQIADTARFGATLATSVSRPFGTVGKGLADLVGSSLKLDLPSIDGRWRYRASYLGSRGILGGVGFEMTEGDRFRLLMSADGIVDRGDDRGLVRVDEGDRSDFRGWLQARGRYYLDDDDEEWIDLRMTRQSDAGVQAEFFEREFLRFEERENFLHWRKAKDQHYISATTKASADDFQTEVDELPEVQGQRGRTPLATWLGVPLLYTARASAGWYRRLEGEVENPFEDGFGDRDLARIDSEHLFEVPLDLGQGGVRFTPFLSGRATAWSEDQLDDSSPVRLSSQAGAELSQSFFKRYEDGWLHALSPSIAYREDLGVKVNGGDPLYIDGLERSPAGRFVDLGLRSLLRNAREKRHLDVDARAQWREDVPGERRAWQLASLAELRFDVGSIPLGVTHDGRYDLSNGDTIYSRSFLGLEPLDNLAVETGYHSGRDRSQARLYEAATVAVRLEATSKWEFEFRQTYDLQERDDLVSRGIVRRLGHDFVVELEVSHRAGEGTSFGFGFDPRLTWRRGSLGILDAFERRASYY